MPGITKSSPLDLYYMPYTHSLDGAILWSLAAGIVYWLFRRTDGWRAAAVVSAAVFSHWVLDLLVHRPDLPIYNNSLKLGLGLWNHPVAALALEFAVLFGGMYLYLRTTEAITRGGRYGMVVFGLAMACLHVAVFFGPPPSSDRAAAIMALAGYAVFAAAAYWLERMRAPRTAPRSMRTHSAIPAR